MRRMLLSVIVTFLLATAASFASAPTADHGVFNYEGQKQAPEGTKRIVFIAGRESHGSVGSHEFYAGSLYLARKINETYPNAWAVVYGNDKWPTDLSNIDDFVIILNHGGKAAEDPQIKAACDKGAGFMSVHWGTEVDKGKQGDNYDAWQGGHCETFWSVNPFWKPEMTIGKHPITNGVKPFTVNDEWYYHMRFVDGMKGVTPILSAVAPLDTVHFKEGDKPSDRGGNADVLKSVQNKEPQVMAWAYDRKEGGRDNAGRGFGFTGFHVFDNLMNDSYRTTLLNAVAWTAKLDVPADGVASKTPTTEEMTALLKEAHPELKTSDAK